MSDWYGPGATSVGVSANHGCTYCRLGTPFYPYSTKSLMLESDLHLIVKTYKL